MNDTERVATAPNDPVMAAPDPAMFEPMNRGENKVLTAHLSSGWYKQDAVYPVLSEPWRETGAILDDLHVAWRANFNAEHGEPEIEAGA
jgi:hypothetical protein